jgi:hypothetical protein
MRADRRVVRGYKAHQSVGGFRPARHAPTRESGPAWIFMHDCPATATHGSAADRANRPGTFSPGTALNSCRASSLAEAG